MSYHSTTSYINISGDFGGQETDQARLHKQARQRLQQEVLQILMGFRDAYTRPHWPLRIESIAQLPILPNTKIDTQGLALTPGKQLHWRQRT